VRPPQRRRQENDNHHAEVVFVKMQELALGDKQYTNVTCIDSHGRITKNKDFRDQDWTKGYVSVTNRYSRLIALSAAMKMVIANCISL